MNKKLLYNDQFFAGDPGKVIHFIASIYEYGDFEPRTKTLDVEIGDVGSGLELYYDLEDPDERDEALRVVRKLTEGFRNLLSTLERRDGHRS